jgi:hypothetical protein
LRKVLIPLALLMALAAGGIAYAANTYSVSGSVSPTREGTPRNPQPIQLTFGYEVGSEDGTRPTPVKRYSIGFAGGRVNTNPFPKCSISRIRDANGDDACPRGSAVGSGFIQNATGPSNNPSSSPIACNAALTVYNSGNNRAVIYVEGTQTSTDPRTRCDINLAAPIPARFVRRGQFTYLEFTVPDSLLHPAPGIDNAVTNVTSTIRRLTRRVRGRTVGFFESVGGCTNGRGRVQVIFTPEEGSRATARSTFRCRGR